ncbi:MAG: replicative DNA helicase [Bacteroidota bacterium]
MPDSNSPIKQIKNYRGKKKGSDLSSYVFGKVQPQALPLEEAVLGAIMLDKDALPIVLDILRAESFYSDAHQMIFKAMLRLFEKTQPVDLLTVTEELRKGGDLEAVGGPYYLVELTNRVTSSANIEYHARIISQKHIQRELISVSTNIIRDAYEDTTDVFDLLDQAEQGLFAITQQNLSRGYESMGALASRALKQLEELAQKEEGLTGVPTGFIELDRLTSGWQSSDLIIVAARPGMGKTSFTLALARNAAMDFSKGVAFFSLEMSNLQLVQRLISLEAEISGSKLRNGQLEDYEWQQLQSAIEKMSEVPIYIDDTPGINVFELRAKCRRLKMQHDIQLVIIDYLQLMTGGGENSKGNREQEISSISRALKGLAKELSVPVIALSQLSRAVETRGGTKRPQLSDLRECITGDTLIYLADKGIYKRVDELLGQSGFSVLAMNEELKLQEATCLDVWETGEKEVFEVETQSGHTIRASLNHPFYTVDGWQQLVDLKEGDYVATGRQIKGPGQESDLKDQEISLLAHMIGDGCYVERQPIHYTSQEEASLDIVAKCAAQLWGIAPRKEKGFTERSLQAAINKQYCGSTLYKSNLSRARMERIARVLEAEELKHLANSDIKWEKIKSIKHIGKEMTYDLHVQDHHNFVANDFIIHNSGAIEQDADIVSFIYRPEYYQILEDEEGQSLKGVAEIIVAKHRNGALKTVKLKFTDQFAKFSDLEDPNFNELTDEGAAFNNAPPNVITRSSRMNDEDIPF